MNANGSGLITLTKLTSQSVSSTHAAWSPDGTRIAFDSTRALDGSNTLAPIANIWVINPDGSGATPLTRLTDALAASVSPVWSPDGTKLAFISSRALNGLDAAITNRNIWAMNPDGTGPQPLTRLTTAPNIDPAWSPDGKKIAFVSPRALDGSDTLGTGGNIWLMNADGSGATPLTRLTAFQNMVMATPVWSPDGRRIAFVSSRALDGSDAGGSVLNIWLMNADGSSATPLTKFTAATNFQPSWSSDGSRIILASTRALDGSNAPNTNATSNIWIMNSDGTGAKPLTKNAASDADNTGPQLLK